MAGTAGAGTANAVTNPIAAWVTMMQVSIRENLEFWEQKDQEIEEEHSVPDYERLI